MYQTDVEKLCVNVKAHAIAAGLLMKSTFGKGRTGQNLLRSSIQIFQLIIGGLLS
jgi:hypothetical protein